MTKTHHYTLSVEWTGNTGSGTSGYSVYERSHSIRSGNKAQILASSDPAFRGDHSKYNPEELLLSSLSSCHMLWYLNLCSEAGVVVLSYSDHPEGIMSEETNGSGRFTEVTLKPRATVEKEEMKERAIQLHHKASEMCFIRNSVNFPVSHQPQIIVAERK